MKKILSLFALSFLLACGPKVSYDFDNRADFSKYRTFNFYPELKSGLSELDEKRVIDQLERQLSVKGIRRGDNPDFFVNFYTSQFETPSQQSVGIGFGTFGRRSGGTVSTGFPVGGNVLNQRITIDFVDVTSGSQVWQGQLASKVKARANPEEREIYYANLIGKILAKYPPRRK
ncbi:MAG: DUF4136 domain-containing protein [Flavobacteriaceae bacterium]|nr:DUF4136 domain-containing protein [Flavobacteriaceae bacterium]